MAEILIVEDDKSINELIQRTLRMMGTQGFRHILAVRPLKP